MRRESSTTMAAVEPGAPHRAQRIPAMLQSVFLNSNRGKEVLKPPPEQVAQKTYEENWVYRRQEARKSKKTYEHSKDKVLSKNKKSKSKEKEDKKKKSKSSSTDKKKKKSKKKTLDRTTLTLQQYFDEVLKSRGYKPALVNTLETGYYNAPTEYQISSYGPRMVQIVKSSDGPALQETLAGGLSPNPCNQFGESLLHMLCRRGDKKLLDIMIEAGTVLEVCDDYGRTPLHDACWAANPAFEVVKTILARDKYMFFMKDRRGSLPLSYVHKDDWEEWMDWFDANIDNFYPKSMAESFAPSDLCNLSPGSMPLPTYKTELSMGLIRMVANGELSPSEARVMAETARQEESSVAADTFLDSDSEYDSDSDYDSDYDSEDDDDSCVSESEYGEMAEDDLLEMMQMLQTAQKQRASKWAH